MSKRKVTRTGIHAADVFLWIAKHRTTRQFTASEVAEGMGYSRTASTKQRERKTVTDIVGRLYKAGKIICTTPKKSKWRWYKLNRQMRQPRHTSAAPLSTPRSIQSKLDLIESTLAHVKSELDKSNQMVKRMLNEWGVSYDSTTD